MIESNGTPPQRGAVVVVTTLICDRCGARVPEADVAPALPVPTMAHANAIRAELGIGERLTEEPVAPVQHWSRRSGFGGGRLRCGPVRPANEWDEWLWRLGAVRP